jgi:orotidine 5'-phosphate decarboxylase subfamily 2
VTIQVEVATILQTSHFFYYTGIDFARTPAMASFRSKLEARIAAVNSFLCVGLDPHEKELNLNYATATDAQKCDAAFTFCQTLVDATASTTVCYKPNAAFFEALGDGGMETLKRVCDTVIPSDIPIVLDVKRGDIGTTAAAYATACYEYVGADAVTLSPLMGWDSIRPFVTGRIYLGKTICGSEKSVCTMIRLLANIYRVFLSI